jgi:hypothetical protein
MAFNEEDKTEAYQDTDIIIDNDDVLFVKSNSYTSAKYFGTDFAVKYYTKKYRNGDLYFIFDKKDPYPQSEPHIYTIFIPEPEYVRGEYKSKKPELYDPRERDIEIYEIIQKFPFIEDKLIDALGVNDTYQALVKISNGNDIDKYELGRIDNLIVDIRFNVKNPGKSMIVLQFDDMDDYVSLFYEDDQHTWFIKSMYSHYDSFEFNDYYSAENDWEEGYLLRDFSNENINKLKEILTLISPNIKNLSDDEDYSEASKLLSNMFDRNVSNIVSDWSDEMNDCKTRKSKQEIEDELCDPFANYGIISKGGCFDKYVTTVNILLGLYNTYKTKSEDLRGILKKVGLGLDATEFGEYAYEVDCYDFNHESFQKTVTRELDSILTQLEDDARFPELEKYREVLGSVLTKYDLNRIYQLPSDKNKRFRITSIDPKTKTIFVDYGKDRGTPTEKRSYDLEGFNNFLHTPELFEQKIRRFKK